MRQSTKNRIIEVGAEIMHLKGFNHTGIQEILDAAGVPKGSFYNYFKSKEDFGLQVIDYFVGYFSLFTEGIISERSLSPLEKIRRILEQFISFFESKDYAYGCPVGNLSQEMGDLSPAFREKLKEALKYPNRLIPQKRPISSSPAGMGR
jgi:TetR/AcrR family transcriptional repressor of nem operon